MSKAKKLVVPERQFFKEVQDDPIMLPNEKASFSEYFSHNGEPAVVRKGMECVIISNGKLVNVVSDSYGHLPNENFFLEVERKLAEADIQYTKRSINRDDVSFAVDYILSDDSFHTDVKAAGAKLTLFALH